METGKLANETNFDKSSATIFSNISSFPWDIDETHSGQWTELSRNSSCFTKLQINSLFTPKKVSSAPNSLLNIPLWKKIGNHCFMCIKTYFLSYAENCWCPIFCIDVYLFVCIKKTRHCNIYSCYIKNYVIFISCGKLYHVASTWFVLFIKFSLETKTFSYKCSTCPRSDLHGIKKHTLLCHFVQFNYNFIHKINLLNYVTDVFLIDS